MDTQAWIDQTRARTTEMIRRHGWFIEYVGGDQCDCPDCAGREEDGPPFAYTVGLFGLGHPELLVFGLGPDAAGTVLNAFGKMIRRGENLVPGQLVSLPGGHHQFVVEEVPNPGEIVFGANDFYQRPPEASVPVLQLTYDDGNGVFPWDPDYPVPEMQPRPGTFRA
ncbi:MAG TPA: DUF4262 domain-containing protein [Acidimicrobiia bacterium]|nr:DUF4262 domain-containing protein [Acidimicrobiia bacterium]